MTQRDPGLNPRPTWLMRNNRAKADEELVAAINEVRLRDWPLELIEIDSFEGADFPAKLEAMLRAAAAAGVGAIAAAGGDGTQHAVASALWNAAPNDLVLAPLPYGTGNDLCRSLDRLDSPPLHLLESAMIGTPHPIDLITTRDEAGREEVLLNCAVWGSAARATAGADGAAKQDLGWLAYVLRGLSEVELEPWPLRLSIDGQSVFDAQARFLSIGKGRTTGGGWVVAPDAWLDDGSMHVRVVSNDQSLVGAVAEQLARRVRAPGSQGAQAEAPEPEPESESGMNASVFSGRKIEIHVPAGLPCNLDGEPSASPVTRLEVRPAAIRVVVGGDNPCLRGTGATGD